MYSFDTVTRLPLVDSNAATAGGYGWAAAAIAMYPTTQVVVADTRYVSVSLRFTSALPSSFRNDTT